MSFNADKVVDENMKSNKKIGEIFGVNPEYYKGVDITEIGCSARVNSAVLRHANRFEVKTLYDLLVITLDELYTIRNLGIGGIKEIVKMAKAYIDEHKSVESKKLDPIFDAHIIFGTNVRNIRATKKKSQIAFAKNCGIGLAALRSIEKETGNPPLSTMSSIARYVGCETSQLFEEDFSSTRQW